jgi:hypothetical protein
MRAEPAFHQLFSFQQYQQYQQYQVAPALHCPYSCSTRTSPPPAVIVPYHNFIARIRVVPPLHRPNSFRISTSSPAFQNYQQYQQYQVAPSLHRPYLCRTSTSSESPVIVHYQHFITHIFAAPALHRLYSYQQFQQCQQYQVAPALHHPISCRTSTSSPVIVPYQHFIARFRAEPALHSPCSLRTSFSYHSPHFLAPLYPPNICCAKAIAPSALVFFTCRVACSLDHIWILY